MANDGAIKLSKNLLRMKFMQRGLDAETKKQLEEEEKRIISDEHWFLDLPELKEKENFIIEERSFVPCENLVYGRMSFKGFNQDVEKLMILMNSQSKTNEEEEKEDSREADISDEEMAKRYETMVESIRKRFKKKRDRTQEEDVQGPDVKKAFLKPQD
ncbi:M-phase phosphoprotein 6 [Erpetoichthys calabaricus]|uniref:M-phase phosphoprotein 6 n=1 Tax=Erpetoichthys calabaricus TaxID=27687 RepID=A0A8C4SHZ1_ERPCA|nr:M-phase phosphoprotein 6 [Erpetoichthys calabaricus]